MRIVIKFRRVIDGRAGKEVHGSERLEAMERSTQEGCSRESKNPACPPLVVMVMFNVEGRASLLRPPIGIIGSSWAVMIVAGIFRLASIRPVRA